MSEKDAGPLRKLGELSKSRNLPNFIILGADGTGKDTLCTELGQILGVEPRKFPGVIPESLTEAFELSLAASREAEPNTGLLWNRFYYPDDLIYGEVVREDPAEVTREWRREFRQEIVPELRRARFHVVLLRIDTKTAEDRGVLTKPTEAGGTNVEKYHNLSWWQWDKICRRYLEEVNDYIRYELPTRAFDSSKVAPAWIAESLMQFVAVSQNDPRWSR